MIATLFVVTPAVTGIAREHTLAGGVLRLDAGGAAADEPWAVALVPFGPERGAPRWCLVAAPGTDVFVRGARVFGGVTEVTDRDHVVAGDLELILSTDALPIPIANGGSPCTVCCATAESGERAGLYRCPRCGLVACESCWTLAPKGRCLTPGCEQPAALDRPLWVPGPADLLLAAPGGEEVPA